MFLPQVLISYNLLLGQHRWNHQIVLRSPGDARSKWLGDLLALAYRYGQD